VDDEDLLDSMPPEQRYERACLDRHRALFVGAFGPALIAVWMGRFPLVSAALFGVAALCWAVSGLQAIRGRRHMFGMMGGGPWGNVRVSPSQRSPVGAWVVGVILILLAVGLLNVAVQVALR
jgi:hypothetical protein